MKVDIIEAVKDPDYFLKWIDVCEKSRSEEIERIEKQLPLEDLDTLPLAPRKSEFQILQESDEQNYLRKTILPLLNTV